MLSRLCVIRGSDDSRDLDEASPACASPPGVSSTADDLLSRLGALVTFCWSFDQLQLIKGKVSGDVEFFRDYFESNRSRVTEDFGWNKNFCSVRDSRSRLFVLGLAS